MRTRLLIAFLESKQEYALQQFERSTKQGNDNNAYFWTGYVLAIAELMQFVKKESERDEHG